ncbi:MAG TPA: radical SAM protein [Methanotrichaceae archaeon]|nr:radical SAM protein [Methanotrichaceae archaeon]
MLIIAWEVTSACNLKCCYCRASATPTPSVGELNTAEAMAFIDDVAGLKPMLILSGGEPLLRPDIFALARHAVDRGLRVSLATNGTLMTPDMVAKVARSGIVRVSISLDGATPDINDATRGSGAYQAALRGMKNLKGHLEFQINMTITRRNEGEIEPLLNLAEEVGARAVHFFFLVPTGRGREEDLISAERQEELLRQIARECASRKIEIQVTCAPQYARIAAESGLSLGQRRAGGCLAGRSFVFVSRRGDVYPCGYLPVLAGNILARKFTEIWESSEVLKALRDRQLTGSCGTCAYNQACGGCRARAYAASGDFLGPDPLCTFEAR